MDKTKVSHKISPIRKYTRFINGHQIAYILSWVKFRYSSLGQVH